MGLENQVRVRPYRAVNELNKIFSRNACLAPREWKGECHGTIVNAHTVPRSGSLSKIARDGHVYLRVRKLSVRTFIKMEMFKLSLRGTKKASTFKGFCSKHDNNIFRPLEDGVFNGTHEQCFLVCYRAITRELYFKQGHVRSLPFFEWFGKWMDATAQYVMRVKRGAQDALYYKSLCDSKIVDQDFRSIRGYVVEFSGIIPVMCSGSIFPEKDLSGKSIQDLNDLTKTLDLLSYSSFASGENGVVVFSWLAEREQACQAFIDSLMDVSDEDLFQLLVYFFFTCCENICVNPDWWEAQSDDVRRMLEMAFLTDVLQIPPLISACGLRYTATVVNKYEING